jgi:hypothetical protein
MQADPAAPPPEGTGACYVWSNQDEREYEMLSTTLKELEAKRENYILKLRHNAFKEALLHLIDTATSYINDASRHCHALEISLPRTYGPYKAPCLLKMTFEIDPETANRLAAIAENRELSL